MFEQFRDGFGGNAQGGSPWEQWQKQWARPQQQPQQQPQPPAYMPAPEPRSYPTMPTQPAHDFFGALAQPAATSTSMFATAQQPQQPQFGAPDRQMIEDQKRSANTFDQLTAQPDPRHGGAFGGGFAGNFLGGLDRLSGGAIGRAIPGGFGGGGPSGPPDTRFGRPNNL